MNMKKTFAGAMAGALAVSAMATSASAAVPGPGEYTVDLTKDAEFYATVQFTLDGDYMLSKAIADLADTSNDKVLGLNFTDASGLLDIANMKDLTVEVVGTTGTKTQTLKYNTTWNDVNFYNWNLFNYSASSKAGTFKLPVSGNGVSTDAQALYVNKYNTVKEALAVKMSDGNKKYPVSGVYNAATNTWTDDATQKELDLPYFDKIVVTAKIPANASKTLDNLNGINAVGGYKTKVSLTISGLQDLAIYEISDDAAAANVATAKAEVTALKAGKVAMLKAQSSKKAADDGAAAAGDAAALKAAATAAYGAMGADAKVAAKDGEKVVYTEIGGSAFIGEGATAKDVTADLANIKAYNTALEKYEAQKALEDTAAADAKAYAALGYTYTTEAEFDAAIDAAQDKVDTAAAASKGTYVGVEVKSTTPTAETLFTKFESNKVGVKSGIEVVDGVVKTVSGDVGAWKPDALRQIRDAIANNSGVTLTFTAKDNFDDAAFRAWAKSVGGANLNWTATNGVWDTDSVKDSYDTWGVSMFTGAIVLNRDFSKQFSTSGLVDWGTNTITFDWDELTEGRFYDASVVLHSLELLSTQNVEWVTCTVTVPEQEAASDSADSSQGKTEDPDEIETTPVETEVITEAPVETEAPATEAPAETTAVAPVENIPTGNAPVALAVIPVALAAAAVIAKKRG